MMASPIAATLPERSTAAAVTPRWEWRVAEPAPSARIAALGNGTAAEAPSHAMSHEIYLLSSASPHNVKIRHGQLDVKRLERVTRRHVEQWRPVFVHPFPIPADELGPVFEAWGITPPVLDRDEYSLAHLLVDVVGADPRLGAVRVSKRRVRFQVGACAAERALLDIEGAAWETFALESEDPAGVLEAVDALGARWGAPLPDGTNYPALLKAVRDAATFVPPLSGARI